MTATNHILTGSVIALAINQPALAIPIAFISHFVTDAIPHFAGMWDDDVFARNRKFLFKFSVAIDTTLSIALLIILPLALRDAVSPWVLLACAIAALSPDIGIIYRFFHEVKTQKWDLPKSLFMRFHLWVEWCEVWWGIFVELVWAALMAFLILELK